jgi:hypothetical protein
MEENKLIQVSFGSDEIQLYNMAQQHCADKHLDMTSYIKDLIKRDLAWGQFARPKKRNSEKKG